MRIIQFVGMAIYFQIVPGSERGRKSHSRCSCFRGKESAETSSSNSEASSSTPAGIVGDPSNRGGIPHRPSNPSSTLERIEARRYSSRSLARLMSSSSSSASSSTPAGTVGGPSNRASISQRPSSSTSTSAGIVGGPSNGASTSQRPSNLSTSLDSSRDARRCSPQRLARPISTSNSAASSSTSAGMIAESSNRGSTSQRPSNPSSTLDSARCSPQRLAKPISSSNSVASSSTSAGMIAESSNRRSTTQRLSNSSSNSLIEERRNSPQRLARGTTISNSSATGSTSAVPGSYDRGNPPQRPYDTSSRSEIVQFWNEFHEYLQNNKESETLKQFWINYAEYMRASEEKRKTLAPRGDRVGMVDENQAFLRKVAPRELDYATKELCVNLKLFGKDTANTWHNGRDVAMEQSYKRMLSDICQEATRMLNVRSMKNGFYPKGTRDGQYVCGDEPISGGLVIGQCVQSFGDDYYDAVAYFRVIIKMSRAWKDYVFLAIPNLYRRNNIVVAWTGQEGYFRDL